MHVLYSWLGKSDLKAPTEHNGRGPALDALLHLEPLERAVLLCDDPDQERVSAYETWVLGQMHRATRQITIDLKRLPHKSPIDYPWVYSQMRKAVHAEGAAGTGPIRRYYLVGPGTSTMAACTVFIARLAATEGKLLQTDEMDPRGFRDLELPFNFFLEDAPDPHSAPSSERLDVGIVRDSSSTACAFRLAQIAAPSEAPVLILGNTGTGKEKLAYALHEYSHRRGKFIAVNCAAIPETLMESELFGYKKGAFTGATQDSEGKFEAARDGTLFLDEIGELPRQLQSKLLRVLQEKQIVRLGDNQDRPVNCRIVAAAKPNLWGAVEDQKFAPDLYFRLAVLILELEDLAHRPEDLQKMIEIFWESIVKKNQGFPGKELTPQAKTRLQQYAWPGNVRELQAVLTRAAFLAQGPEVGEQDVHLAIGNVGRLKEISPQKPLAAPIPIGGPLPTLGEETDRCRRELVERALQAAKSKKEAAEILGISNQQLYRLINRYRIRHPGPEAGD